MPTLYRHIIGLLVYLTNTRPDICFVVNMLSQYMVNPKYIHLIGEKHVMRYVKGTLDYGLRYASNGKIRLYGFIHSDWEGSSKYRYRTSECCLSLGPGMMSWFCIKNTNIALSTVEAEYIEACSACNEAVWL